MTKTVHKTLPETCICVSKTGPCAVISSHTSSQFNGEALAFGGGVGGGGHCCQLSRIIGQSQVSNNRGFWPSHRQVAIILAALSKVSHWLTVTDGVSLLIPVISSWLSSLYSKRAK